MARLESLLRPLSNASPARLKPPELGDVPPAIALVEEARRYARSADIRATVHDIVLKELEAIPDRSRVLILAHSLGTVVAADLLNKLPSNLVVAALVTIGSPLGSIAAFRPRDLADDFPCDRVKAWINVFEPRDPVTGGRGISPYFPMAIDVPVTLDDWWVPALTHQHGAEYYCAHGAVAAAIGGALMGSEVATRDPEEDSVKGLELFLLQSLYLRELAKRIPADEAERLAHLERARNVVAASNETAASLAHARSPLTAMLTASEFLRRPDAYIRGAWDDRTILALAIMLASGPPAAPFQIEEKPDVEERRMALIATLSLIRTDRGQHTDVDIVDAIFSARPEIANLLGASRSWVPAVLVAAGVLTLAATGVGLAIAAPAGLVGAAVITSTLAAFGPGGMVGGMATLAALAGAGSALAAAGAALGATGLSRSAPDLLANALAEAIASADPEALRSLLVSLLTLIAVQERLEFGTQRDQVLSACLNAQAQLSQRVFQHSLIDPKSPATKAAKQMLALLEKSCRWLRGEEDSNSADADQWAHLSSAYSEALDGRPGLLAEIYAGAGRDRPEPPQIESRPGS
jgi:hypothetical protein